MSDPQLAAISLKMDRLLAGQEALTERVESLELCLGAILQGLQHEQRPMLGTIIEMLEKLLAAAASENAGGEMAMALKQLAAEIAALVEQDGKLTDAVAMLPTLIEESVARAGDRDFDEVVDVEGRP